MPPFACTAAALGRVNLPPYTRILNRRSRLQAALLLTMLPVQALAQYMTLSNGVQSPQLNVDAGTPITYTFDIENLGKTDSEPPVPGGSSGAIETRFIVRVSGLTQAANSGAFTSPDCSVDPDDNTRWKCPDLAAGGSQTVSFTWVNPFDGGIREVDFVGAWNFVPPDETVGGESSPVLIGFESVVGYEQFQTFERRLSFSGTFAPASATGTAGSVWDGTTRVDAITNDPVLGKNGFALSLASSGDIGVKISVAREEVAYRGELPVEVRFEMPAGGVVAPEETFTVSTDWFTPNPTGNPSDGAQFRAESPGPVDVTLGLNYEMDFDMDTEGCWQGRCETPGEITDLDGPVNTAFDFFTMGRRPSGEKFIQDRFAARQKQTYAEFFFPEDVTNAVGEIPDPLTIDVLGFIKADLTGLSSISFGTDFSNAGAVEKNTATSVPKGSSVSNGWSENAFELSLDLTNIAPIALGFKCNCPAFLLNGTIGEMATIAAAKIDKGFLGLSGPRKTRTLAALKVLGWLRFIFDIFYVIVEAELEGVYDVANKFQLTPKAPELRIRNGDELLTSWFFAGEDITLTMPSEPVVLTVEARTEPTFFSQLMVLAQETRINFRAASIGVKPYNENKPVVDVLSNTGPGVILGQQVQYANPGQQEFSGFLALPNPLTTPRGSLSGGGGIAFGGGNCWEPDNLDPGTPSGISFDENDGCVVSFRDMGLNGTVTLDSHSDTEISLTLLNTTFSGSGDGLVDVTLDPNGDTSIQLTGETRRPGLDSIDLFFDDSGSSGNQNRIIVNTVNGAFIRNSLLRGLTSNENQSDVILEDGNLWIENTGMTLDNLTVENGAISIQDSRAELRNLQVGGASESALRLTRDTLITTNSPASFNSSNLEIGNGSLVNVSGLLRNTGALLLEPGGWLTVLEGDNPTYPDRLGGTELNPGVVNIVGLGQEAPKEAARALVPVPITGPVSLFENQVAGSRLDTGVLLLSNGEIENHQINIAGGTMITSGGTINDSTLTLSDNGFLVIEDEPLVLNNSSINGTGTIEIFEGGSWVLNATTVGEGQAGPANLNIVMRGAMNAGGVTEFAGNTSFTNYSTVLIEAARQLLFARFQQNDGALVIDGSMTVDEPASILGGQVSGIGTFLGTLVNQSGELSATGLTIDGDYVQLDTANLVLDLPLPGEPFLTVTGAVEADGFLTVVLSQAGLDSLTPGSEFEFMSYASITGEFSRVNVRLEDGSGVSDWKAEVIYGSNRASLRWQEEPETEFPQIPIHRDGFDIKR